MAPWGLLRETSSPTQCLTTNDSARFQTRVCVCYLPRRWPQMWRKCGEKVCFQCRSGARRLADKPARRNGFRTECFKRRATCVNRETPQAAAAPPPPRAAPASARRGRGRMEEAPTTSAATDRNAAVAATAVALATERVGASRLPPAASGNGDVGEAEVGRSGGSAPCRRRRQHLLPRPPRPRFAPSK